MHAKFKAKQESMKAQLKAKMNDQIWQITNALSLDLDMVHVEVTQQVAATKGQGRDGHLVSKAKESQSVGG